MVPNAAGVGAEGKSLRPPHMTLGVVMDGILSFSFTEKTIPNVIISHRYKAQDTPARKTFEQALTGAFMSAVIKDLRPSALPFVASLIRHYTMVAVAQQCGEFAACGSQGHQVKLSCEQSKVFSSHGLH